MSRAWPIALIVVAVVVIGVFTADTLGIIRVPSLASSSGEADTEDELEEEPLDGEATDERRRVRRTSKKRKTKPAEPPKKVDKPPPPPPKPAKKGPRFSMPTPSSITTSKLPAEVNLDAIHAAIGRQAPAFKRCLQDATKEGADLPGRVLVSMTASPYGKITENHIKDRAVERSALGRCVLRKSGSIRLPSFSGDPITVAFPLTVVE